MKAKRLFFLLLMFWLVTCSSDQSEQNVAKSQEITVFAAASLSDAFTELTDAFEAQNEGVQVVLNFSGSSQLAAQLSEGAVADVFASANAAQMQVLIEADRIEEGSEKPFVSNRLTIVVPVDNPAQITVLENLAQPGVKLILAVEGVPVRQYTDEIVATMAADFQEQFYGNVVSEEDNVRQVSAKVVLGEADAGIVYTSDVTPEMADQIQQIAIPEAQNVIATYPIAPLADAPYPQVAQRFIDFVLSEEGQTILTRWGFGPAPTLQGR